MSAGDDIVRTRLSLVRALANDCRARMVEPLPRYAGFVDGLCTGSIIIARVYLEADADAAMGASHEIRFLLGPYLQ